MGQSGEGQKVKGMTFINNEEKSADQCMAVKFIKFDVSWYVW